jgi:hypothetical protein
VEFRYCDETEFAFGWLLDEFLRRTSHALVDGGRVWLVDPVAVPGIDERIREAGEPAGVIQLLDRHARDSAELARRLGVELHVVPKRRVGPFETIDLGRRESALWWPERRTLVAADALGTVGYFLAPGERLGVHPFRRLRPPRKLGEVVPEHVLVGHGEGIHERADDALREALGGARRRVPSLLAAGLRGHVLKRRRS